MDPDTTLKNLCAAFEDAASDDTEDLLERIDALVAWHDRGGFMPRAPEQIEAMAINLDGRLAFALGRLVGAIEAEIPKQYGSALAWLRLVVATST